jgi:uncharacterized protein YjbI with pentapeptide repeats
MEADLRGADLTDAVLRILFQQRADTRGAIMSVEQRADAKSRGAILE